MYSTKTKNHEITLVPDSIIAKTTTHVPTLRSKPRPTETPKLCSYLSAIANTGTIVADAAVIAIICALISGAGQCQHIFPGAEYGSLSKLGRWNTIQYLPGTIDCSSNKTGKRTGLISKRTGKSGLRASRIWPQPVWNVVRPSLLTRRGWTPR